MSAQTHLATYGITMQEAYNYIISNLANPSIIFDTCKQFAVTNDMLAEIVGVDVSIVRGFWEEHSLNSIDLDPIVIPLPIQNYKLTVSSPSIVEENASIYDYYNTKLATVSLQLDTVALSDVSVNYQVSSSSTATIYKDFTGQTTGSVTFHAGELSKNLYFNIIKDTVFEANETIKIDFSGNQISSASSTITILNDDAAPIVQQLYVISGAGTTDASTGNYAFLIIPGNYTHTIANINTGDTFKYNSSITSASVYIVNSSGTINYTDDFNHTQIQLTGIINYDDGIA